MVQEGVLEVARVDARRRRQAWLWFLSGSLAVAGVLPLVPWAAPVRLYEVVSVAGVVAALVSEHLAMVGGTLEVPSRAGSGMLVRARPPIGTEAA